MNQSSAASLADIPASAGSGDTYKPTLLSVTGRIGRVRYLLYNFGITLLFLVVVGVIAAVAVAANNQAYLVMLLVPYVMMFVANIVISRRRINDLDQSGWTLLWFIVPIVNIWIAIRLSCYRGTEGQNQFGAAPVPNTRSRSDYCGRSWL